jgi:hypothetical protein
VHAAHMLACELGSTPAELARTVCSRGRRVVTGKPRVSWSSDLRGCESR